MTAAAAEADAEAEAEADLRARAAAVTSPIYRPSAPGPPETPAPYTAPAGSRRSRQDFGPSFISAAADTPKRTPASRLSSSSTVVLSPSPRAAGNVFAKPRTPASAASSVHRHLRSPGSAFHDVRSPFSVRSVTTPGTASSTLSASVIAYTSPAHAMASMAPTASPRDRNTMLLAVTAANMHAAHAAMGEFDAGAVAEDERAESEEAEHAASLVAMSVFIERTTYVVQDDMHDEHYEDEQDENRSAEAAAESEPESPLSSLSSDSPVTPVRPTSATAARGPTPLPPLPPMAVFTPRRGGASAGLDEYHQHHRAALSTPKVPTRVALASLSSSDDKETGGHDADNQHGAYEPMDLVDDADDVVQSAQDVLASAKKTVGESAAKRELRPRHHTNTTPSIAADTAADAAAKAASSTPSTPSRLRGPTATRAATTPGSVLGRGVHGTPRTPAAATPLWARGSPGSGMMPSRIQPDRSAKHHGTGVRTPGSAGLMGVNASGGRSVYGSPSRLATLRQNTPGRRATVAAAASAVAGSPSGSPRVSGAGMSRMVGSPRTAPSTPLSTSTLRAGTLTPTRFTPRASAAPSAPTAAAAAVAPPTRAVKRKAPTEDQVRDAIKEATIAEARRRPRPAAESTSATAAAAATQPPKKRAKSMSAATSMAASGTGGGSKRTAMATAAPAGSTSSNKSVGGGGVGTAKGGKTSGGKNRKKQQHSSK
ncbi:hypothetical protein BC828DRAFT_391453 [Blastocladiella britannica]|nr:hypothetical protein BC828DRAFT_391453 [Blastocladiella britannica]